MDTDKKDWTSGIERDKLPWINVSNLEGFSSSVADQYKVEKIPTTYLLDQEGKLIAKHLSRTDLLEKLNQLL